MDNRDGVNPYELLGVGRSASNEVITAAYRALLKTHHPDHARDEQERGEREVFCKEIGQAYGTLMDPKRRARIDALYSVESTPSSEGTRPVEQGFDWDDLSFRQKLQLHKAARYYPQYAEQVWELQSRRVRLGRYFPAAWLGLHRGVATPRRKPRWWALGVAGVLGSTYLLLSYWVRTGSLVVEAFERWGMDYLPFSIPRLGWSSEVAQLLLLIGFLSGVILWRIIAPALSERRGGVSAGVVAILGILGVLLIIEEIILLLLAGGLLLGSVLALWYLGEEIILEQER